MAKMKEKSEESVDSFEKKIKKEKLLQKSKNTEENVVSIEKKTKKVETSSQVKKATKNGPGKMLNKKKAKIVDDERKATKENVKQLVGECKANGMSAKKISLIVKKWKRREGRRLKRANERKFKIICFNCRQHGHTVAECPEPVAQGADESSVAGLCFKCGSTEHTVSGCKLKTQGYPYAKCFICKKVGHLSRECDSNPNGIYPEGGSCKKCGKCDHLIKDCPEMRKVGPDEEELCSNSDEERVKKKIEKKSTKVVKF